MGGTSDGAVFMMMAASHEDAAVGSRSIAPNQNAPDVLFILVYALVESWDGYSVSAGYTQFPIRYFRVATQIESIHEISQSRGVAPMDVF